MTTQPTPLADPVAAQRDLFARLLEVGAEEDPTAFLDEVLGLLTSATGAKSGYAAVGPGTGTRAPAWWRVHGISDEQNVASIKERVSTSLLQQAMVDGVVHTSSAQNDPRFKDSRSVIRNEIQAVLCAALQVKGHVVGVLYLQGGPISGMFTDAQEELIERAARHLAPAAARIARALRYADADPTANVRKRLCADDIIGQSPALADMLANVAVCAQAPVRVMLTGATGTGKSSVARVIHDSGPRSDEPFTVINCANLSAERLEADLFGAKAGSYTGLNADRVGLVETTSSGTLFLDEFLEMSSAVQAKLLTFVQDGTYRRLGDTEERAATEIRIISATNQSPRTAMREGRFREDLLFRLSEFKIAVPTLAERADDIALLCHSLLDRIARAYSLPALPLSNLAMADLESRQWKGNIRELESVLKRALLFATSESAKRITLAHLDAGPDGPHENSFFRDKVYRFKRRLVIGALQESRGKKSVAADKLGVSRGHLYSLLRELDIGADDAEFKH